MKIKNSLKSLKARHRDNRLVRRKGRVLHHQQAEPALQGSSGLIADGDLHFRCAALS